MRIPFVGAAAVVALALIPSAGDAAVRSCGTMSAAGGDVLQV
jgi:hypothetical protein